MALRFQPVRNVGADIQEKVAGEEARTYSGQGAGGKLRLSRRGSRKATPYDRPASGRHATAGGLSTSDSAAEASSLASRLVGSASRFITSSASYFFPSLFGRRTLALTQSNPVPVLEAVAEEQEKQEEPEPFINQETGYMNKNTMDQGQEQALVAVGSKKLEKREFDLARVEDMLKQKAWSREQVGRLTDLLNTRLIEHPPTVSRSAEAVSQQPSDAAAHAGDSPPISEAQRWREELKRARTDCVPVEVARAYMGEQTSLLSSLTPSFRGTTHQMDRGAELQPPPGLGLAENRFRSFPVLRSSRTRSPASHLLKKGPLLDEEWMSVGPVRRTRHKLFHMNSSPYARALPGVDPVVPRTYGSPPVQSSQTARKILDTLEMLSPSPKCKHVNDKPTEAGTPDLWSSQGRRNVHLTESFKFSSVRDTCPSNGRLEFGSPSNHLTSRFGTKKESHIEEKSLVSRHLASIETGFFSGTRSLASSSATTSAPILSIQAEIKPLFTCTLPPLKPEVNSIPPGSCSAVPALAKWPESTWSPSRLLTPSNTLFSAEAPLLMPSTDGLSVPSESLSKEAIRVDSDHGQSSLQFGSPSLGSPFAFKVGSSDSQMVAKGLHSSFREDGAFGAQSELSLPVSLPASPFMLTSTPAVCTVTTAVTSSASASSGLSSLFGSLQSSSPFFKASPTGELFCVSSMSKPVTIAPLTLDASSAPFTFSPPPPPLVSCSTPSFSFCSSAGAVNVSFETSASESEDLNTTPVFNFTSPSGGRKVPVVALEDVFLPAPTFTFGGGAPASGVMGSGSTFSFGPLTSPPTGTLVAPVTAGSSGGQLEVTGSLPQQQVFKYGGQATSSGLFPFSSVDNVQAPAGLEAPASFASGASGLEKSGRKFLKVKRRK